MPLPNTAPIRTPGPPGFIAWLQRESAPHGLLPGVFQHLRSNAPHVISQAALHGLGQDFNVDLTASQAAADTVDTSTFFSPSASSYTPPDITSYPTSDPTLPGGQSGGWADTIAQLVTPVITGAEQIKLFNTQLSLAQQGKPPLNTANLRLPTVPLSFSVAGMGGSSGWLIAGVAGVLGLMFFGGRRRR